MPQTNESAHRDLAGLKPGEQVQDQVYLVRQKELRTTNHGELYIHAVLGDRSGQMVARMWQASRELYESMRENRLLYFRGRVESYKGRPQFIIDGMRAADDAGVDPSAFLPITRFDVEQMWSRVKQILRGIENRDLLALLAKFVNDDAFAARFKKAPAARSNHHAYLGGLLEHTLSVLELAVLVLPRYPQVSRDLVLAGVFVHDAGKTAELSCETSFDYTDEGQLVGHIVQAAIWVQEKAREIERETGRPFPADVLTALQHIIVSHHGRYEFGSPRLPATAEAFVVHYLDNLDAKLHMVFNAIEADEDEDGHWTAWVAALETRVFKGPSVSPGGVAGRAG